MDKMKMQSKDRTQENFEKLAALFPNAVTETIDENGAVVRAIDKDVLQQEISAVVVEGRDERYQFTWPDKKKSILAANAPIRKTLRPCRGESVNFDTTENLYIEGDNLDVLKLLQETYLGKVKMIYIDPPYNTGSDFVYNDDFKEGANEYLENSGQFDDEGNRLFQNTESNGRFHTDWLNMLYPRLKIARDLLSDDGVIFISINDKEVENLKKICVEIFGSMNFVAQLVWEKKKKGSFLSNAITNIKEYVVVFCKNAHEFEGLIGEINNNTETYPCINAVNKREIRKIPAGIESKYKEKNYFLPKGSIISDTTMSIVLHSDLQIKNGILADTLVLEGNWRYSQEAMYEYAKKNEIYITRDLYLRRIVKDTRYKTLKDILPRIGDNTEISHKDSVDIFNLNSSGWGSNEDADEELRLLFGVQKIIEYPKPSRLITKLLASYRNTKNSYFLDFFAGSATTAHAVMRLNASDGGHRRFIMVQLPEPCDEKSEAYKAGYKNVSEIGKERIRLAGALIQKENDQLKNTPLIENEEQAIAFADAAYAGSDTLAEFTSTLEHVDASKTIDTGFRVLKLDSTNMKDVYYNPHDVQMSILDDLADNIKEDRTPEDLLFQVMLDLGILLSSKIEESEIAGKKVFSVADNFLIACFDEDVSDETITAVAKSQPAYFVMRDSSMKNDSVATNFDQIFATYSPDTVRKVI